MSIRVYQLARDLGLDNKEVMQLLNERGLKVTSVSSSIPNIYADSLVEELKHRSCSENPPERKVVVTQENPALSQKMMPAEARKDESNNARVAPAISKATPLRDVVKKEPTHIHESGPLEVVKDMPGENISTEKSCGAEDLEQKTETVSNKGALSVETVIKIPLPKIAPRTPVAFASKRADTPGERSENISAPSAISAVPVRVSNEKIKEDVPAAKQIPSVNVALGGAGDTSLARKKSLPVNYSERRAAPSVHFQISPKNNKQLFNKIKIPGIVEPAEGGNNNKILVLKAPVVVRDLAPKIGLKPFQLISTLMRQGIFASINQQIPEDVAIGIAEKYGYKLEIRQKADPAKLNVPKAKIVAPKELLPRPPVVCVLGHVDHGKTTLLDTIRHATVVAGEAGGITQHIGAYQVEFSGKKITFLDTPGHAAFSNMRERGAAVTDIAILIVAADDGFMPQTDEALKFAQKAGVPVVVAINKIDAKGANIDRVKQQMQQRGIASEDWGGDTLCVGISALKAKNVDELLSLILLQAEMMELKADYKCPASGVIIESQIDVGHGTAATVIVREGTLKIGDSLVCGKQYCRVRSMLNERAEVVKVATPSVAVKVMGWSGVLENGGIFESVKDEKAAKRQAEENEINEKKIAEVPVQRIANMKSLFEAIESQKQKILKVIIKGDVQGSVEALVGCLESIKSERVKLEILDAGVGVISKNDIEFSNSSGAVVVGFNVKMDTGVAPIAKNKGVQVILHNIIYELIDQVKDEMVNLLDYEYSEKYLGTAEVRQIFELKKVTIGGSMVTGGKIIRDKSARVHRGNKVLFEGKVASLKRQKDDQSEVSAGFECGIRIEGFTAFELGDKIECFEMVAHRQTL